MTDLKKPSQSTIYVDVTQLVHLQGQVTGIPRVMRELAVRFAAQPETRFVSWVKSRQSLCEVNFRAMLANPSSGILYLRTGEQLSVADADRTTVSVAGAAVPTLGQGKRLAKRVANRLLRVNPALERRVKDLAATRLASNWRAADMKVGDILFIPWGEWWDEQFTDYVTAQERAGVRVVQIIHDIATTTQPQFFEQVAAKPTTYNAAVLPGAALVLAVSENTKRELTTWLQDQKLHIPRIVTMRNGDNIPTAVTAKPTDENFRRSGLKGNDYLLSVGTLEAKKNHALLYYVYKLAKARDIKLPKLVFVGRHGWLTKEIYHIMTHDADTKDRFIFLHNASDSELAWLYDHCLFSVLPSFHEGWGIPIAESLSRGVPCLCSNTSSMTEIAEGIVTHFNPASPDECLSAIVKLLDPKQLEAERKRARTYKPTTWDDTFKRVESYIKEL